MSFNSITDVDAHELDFTRHRMSWWAFLSTVVIH